MTALVWFRRDLRLHDHPALNAALAEHEKIIPAFCFDDRLVHGRFASGPRTQFMLESLADLQQGLRARGGDLLLRHGVPEEELLKVAKQFAVDTVYFSADVTSYAQNRAAAVRDALAAAGLTMKAYPGVTVVDDIRPIVSRSGTPYTVFTPFFRTWQNIPRRAVLEAPQAIQLPDEVSGTDLPSLQELGLQETVPDPLPGGETAALQRLAWFLDSSIEGYRDGQNALAEPQTSRLSPYLHFGCISSRAIESQLPDYPGALAFRRQLAWRDFYHHVLHHHPGNARQEFQPRYRGTLEWNESESDFEAWQNGQTGFPLVDAGMRQLRQEGWMHNRARLVVGSFLTKDLGIDWRRGEAHFMRYLLDGDMANNNGNWQWIASVGTDPQPVFRRIYNPALHQARFDPNGVYVQKFVPELQRVPDKYLPEPSTMSVAEQARFGCIIGTDYPAPIVDRQAARLAALDRYRV